MSDKNLQQSMRLSVNPATGVLELVPVNSSQNIVISSASSTSSQPSENQTSMSHVAVTTSSGTENQVRVVVEVKEEQPKRPVFVSVGSEPQNNCISLDEHSKAVLHLLEAADPQDLIRAQQIKALIPGLANVCPQFLARIQKAAGPLFLHPEALLPCKPLEISPTPVASSPPKSSYQPQPATSPVLVKVENMPSENSCIFIDSDSEDVLEQKPLIEEQCSDQNVKLEELSVEIGMTSRSRPCLKLRGFTYYQNRKFNDTVYWLCCEARDIKCKGKVTTDNYRIIKLYEFHNHPNEDGKITQPLIVSLPAGHKQSYASDKHMKRPSKSNAVKRKSSSPPAPTHMTLFEEMPSGYSPCKEEEYMSVSDYEDLLELEREELGQLPCVQSVVSDYHEWHAHNEQQQNCKRTVGQPINIVPDICRETDASMLVSVPISEALHKLDNFPGEVKNSITITCSSDKSGKPIPLNIPSTKSKRDALFSSDDNDDDLDPVDPFFIDDNEVTNTPQPSISNSRKNVQPSAKNLDDNVTHVIQVSRSVLVDYQVNEKETLKNKLGAKYKESSQKQTKDKRKDSDSDLDILMIDLSSDSGDDGSRTASLVNCKSADLNSQILKVKTESESANINSPYSNDSSALDILNKEKEKNISSISISNESMKRFNSDSIVHHTSIDKDVTCEVKEIIEVNNYPDQLEEKNSNEEDIDAKTTETNVTQVNPVKETNKAENLSCVTVKDNSLQTNDTRESFSLSRSEKNSKSLDIGIQCQLIGEPLSQIKQRPNYDL